MAIGDKAAAKGLQVFPSTQDRRLGFQNDNQRGDDIADTMTRLDTIEKQQRFVAGEIGDGTDGNGFVKFGHSLGKVPVVTLTGINKGTIPESLTYVVWSKTATQVTVIVYRHDGPAGGRPFVGNNVAFSYALFA